MPSPLEILQAYQKASADGAAEIRQAKQALEEEAKRRAVAESDSRFFVFLQKILGEIMNKPFIKGDKGEKGDKGDTIVGPKGNKGDPGKDAHMIGPKGDKGDRGEKGDTVIGPRGLDGTDGADGIANMTEVKVLTKGQIAQHEKQFDHSKIDPFLIGSHTLNESNIGKGKVLQYNGKELVYALPEKGTEKQIHGGGGVNTNYNFRSITANYTLDPLDGIIHIDATSADITLTFYSALAANDGARTKKHFIKRVDASSHTVSFAFVNNQTLEFQTTFQLPTQGAGVWVYSNSTNWFIS